MIIGITGTLGSGKDTVAEYLVKKYKFQSIGTGDIVREYIKKLNLPNTRDAQRNLANKLRREKGRDFLVRQAIARLKNKNKAITGIRQPREADYFKKQKEAILIAVDAPIQIRFQRLLTRQRPGDPQTLKELIDKEKKEMFGMHGKTSQNISYCMKQADFHLENAGTKATLIKQVEEILKRVYGRKKTK